MGIAVLSSMRSKDPNTQVGACIVNIDQRIIGIGYNGFPKGCLDSQFPWDSTADNPTNTKYMYVIHAEQNAILNATKPLTGCILYVTLFPCHDCTKVIIQSGIREIIYLKEPQEPKYKDSLFASKRMLDFADIRYRQFFGNKTLTISF
jgi:dCMP deaminase